MIGRNAENAERRSRLALPQIPVPDKVFGRDGQLMELLRGADPKAVAIRDNHHPNIIAPEPRLPHQPGRP